MSEKKSVLVLLFLALGFACCMAASFVIIGKEDRQRQKPEPVGAYGGEGKVIEIVQTGGDSWTGAEALPFALVRVELSNSHRLIGTGPIILTALDPSNGKAKVGDPVRAECQDLFHHGAYESSFYFIRLRIATTQLAP